MNDGVAIDGNDPIRIILARVLKDRNSAESQKLIRAVQAVISGRDDITVAELCSLSEEMLGLLDAFARDRMAGLYEQSFLEGLSNRLRSQHEATTVHPPLAA